MATPTFDMYVSQKEFILISKNAATTWGMYIINGVHGPEPRSSGGNTKSNPQVLVLILRPAFNGMERMCQHHGSNRNSHPPVLVRKPLCNQFIHYDISSRGVWGINPFKLRNFAVVAIECSVATVDRGSIMAIEYIDGPWWSMVACRLNLWRPSKTVISIGMEHLSLVKLLIYLNRLTTIVKYFRGCKI